MITAVYVRVSTEDQALSLEAQATACRRYIEMRALTEEYGEPTAVQIYQDVGVSGSIGLESRPEGASLAADIAAGRVHSVVSVRLDRLFRDTSDTLLTLTRWDDQGVALHLLDMGGSAVNTSSAVGRFLITILAGMAEFERKLIAERTAAAKAASRARGDYMGGTVPWGFRLENGKLYPQPMEVMTVQIALAERGRGETWLSIAANLNGRDLTNRGRPWRPDTLVRRIGKPNKAKKTQEEVAA